MSRISHISASMYESRLDEHVEFVVEEARAALPDQPTQNDWFEAVADYTTDSLDGDDWFNSSQYGVSFHGDLIQHTLNDDVDLHRYSDIDLSFCDDPSEMVRRLAYLQFQSAIIDAALEHGPDRPLFK